MSAKAQATVDTDAMYWCLKCDQHHRRNSGIGSWHLGIERPELDEGNVGRTPSSKPDKATFAAAVALALELDERDATEGKFEGYQQRYRDEVFDEFRNARDAIYSLRDQYNDLIVSRHSGHEWVTFEATGNDAMKLKDAAREYKRRGMSFGAYTG